MTDETEIVEYLNPADLDPQTLSDDYYTPEELASRWKTSEGYLGNRRYKNLEPRYIKVGNKVLYSVEAILEYEKNRKRVGRTELVDGEVVRDTGK